jgi:hypothetical protein
LANVVEYLFKPRIFDRLRPNLQIPFAHVFEREDYSGISRNPSGQFGPRGKTDNLAKVGKAGHVGTGRHFGNVEILEFPFENPV